MISLKHLLSEQSNIESENLKTAKTIVAGLVKRGFSSNEAISLAGNMSVESMNVSTGKWFDPNASDGTAYGLMQWQGDRLTALKAFAKYKGSSVSNLATQLDFAKFELKNGYLLYPTDDTKKLKEQLIPGIPVALVYIVDTQGKPSIPRHFTNASTETKAFTKSLKGNIKDTTAALTTNVFRPSEPHIDRRVANALAISNYITNGIVPKGTASKTHKSAGNLYTVKPGETLGGIANRNNTTVDDIVKKNPGLDPGKIRDGQQIKI